MLRAWLDIKKWKVFILLYALVLYIVVYSQSKDYDPYFVLYSLLFWVGAIALYFIKEKFQILTCLAFFTSATCNIGAFYAEWAWGFLLGMSFCFLSVFIPMAHYSFAEQDEMNRNKFKNLNN